MDAEDQSLNRVQKHFRRRAFKPLFLWLPFAMLLILAHVHFQLLKKTRVFFSVAVDGHPIERDYQARLDSLPVQPNQQVGVGPRTFHLSVSDAEPVVKSCFLWYGQNNLGDFNLTAYKGTLQVSADPMPNSIQVTGKWFNVTVTTNHPVFPDLPVGEYSVTAKYPWLRDSKQILVQRDQTNQVDIQPNLGAFDLTVQPAEAQYRLSSLLRPGFVLTGDAPTNLSCLPGGEYHLRIWRGDYLQETNLQIFRGETNRLAMVFEYGQVNLVSDPAGATIYKEGQPIGKTPKVFNELKPGQYHFALLLNGYEPAPVSFEVKGDEALTISTNLVNIRYRAAMQRARQLAASFRPNYQQALTNVDQALEAQPDDPDALALKAKLEADLASQQAQQAEAARQAELQRRQKAANDKFEQITRQIHDAFLFGTHHWTVSGKSINAVRAAILRAFDRPPQRWKVLQQSPDNDPVIFNCEGRIVSTDRRLCVVMASQVGPDQVEVYAKFWDYALTGSPVLSLLGGRASPTAVPVVPGRYLPNQPGAAEKRRRQIAEDFWNNLQHELGNDHGQ